MLRDGGSGAGKERHPLILRGKVAFPTYAMRLVHFRWMGFLHGPFRMNSLHQSKGHKVFVTKVKIYAKSL